MSYEIKPQNAKLEKFSDYVFENNLTKESKFPPHVWASASADLNNSTNACESFHAHFNNSIYHTHPCIIIFVKELLNVQIEAYVKNVIVLALDHLHRKLFYYMRMPSGRKSISGTWQFRDENNERDRRLTE